MYDFSIQQNMLNSSLILLEEKNIENISALGGGTALAAYYWNHRYSTDIDIFIYGDVDKKKLLRPNQWSDKTKSNMEALGYTNDFKLQNIYLEFSIGNDYKMQFFDVKGFTEEPYTQVSLWGKNLNIETIEEIIAKKIHYRCEKGNARDLFDIAIAIHKQPDILNKLGRLNKNRINKLFDTVSLIKNDETLYDNYFIEINKMNPKDTYKKLSLVAINYLHDYLESYCSACKLNYNLTSSELTEIEDIIYDKLTNTG